jgi:hypothetical protein
MFLLSGLACDMLLLNTTDKFYLKEKSKMPWYTNPDITCKVLNRIANRYNCASLKNFRSVMDNATESIWRKQEHYYETASTNEI